MCNVRIKIYLRYVNKFNRPQSDYAVNLYANTLLNSGIGYVTFKEK
jgi:hypothetical protein